MYISCHMIANSLQIQCFWQRKQENHCNFNSICSGCGTMPDWMPSGAMVMSQIDPKHFGKCTNSWLWSSEWLLEGLSSRHRSTPMKELGCWSELAKPVVRLIKNVASMADCPHWFSVPQVMKFWYLIQNSWHMRPRDNWLRAVRPRSTFSNWMPTNIWRLRRNRGSRGVELCFRACLQYKTFVKEDYRNMVWSVRINMIRSAYAGVRDRVLRNCVVILIMWIFPWLNQKRHTQ